MPKHCSVCMESHSQIRNSWKNGKKFKKKLPNAIIVNSEFNKSCSSSMNFHPVHASFCHVAHTSTIPWSISSRQNIENVVSERWYRQISTTQNCGKLLAIGSIIPRTCSNSKWKRKHLHWNQWTAQVIVSFLIIVYVRGVNYHFVWPILVYFTVTNYPELSLDWLVYVNIKQYFYCSYFMILIVTYSTNLTFKNHYRYVVSNKMMLTSFAQMNKSKTKLMHV